MQRVSRHVRACAVVAVTSVTASGLRRGTRGACNSPAFAGQRRADRGRAASRCSIYGGYLEQRRQHGGGEPRSRASRAACLTSTTPACRLERLEGLFRLLASKGVTGIRALRALRLPRRPARIIPGLFAYRALLDKYGLQAGGWHGDMSEANWDVRVNAGKILGADYIGSGGVGDPGIGSYSNTLRTAETLNRLGKRSVEAGLGPVYIHNHQQRVPHASTSHNGVLTTAFDILMDRTDPRFVNAEVDVFWSSDAFQDVDRRPDRGADQQVADPRAAAAHQGRHQRRRDRRNGNPARVRAPASSTSGRSSPPPRASVQYYHQEQDGGTITDADISLTGLKGVGTAGRRHGQRQAGPLGAAWPRAHRRPRTSSR